MTRSKPRRETLYGFEEPRIYTPPKRELTPETSLGFSVIEFADILGIELYPWQRWLLVHMLELEEDGSLRFGTVVVLVARQNGKSTLSQVLALWFMCVQQWPVILGTAQSLDIAEEVWAGAVSLLEEDEELAPLIDKVNKTNGKKSLVLENKSAYKVKSASRGGGRGLSGNLIMLDELREHQNWLAWAAITHTTMAQLHSLILCLSNAGDMKSVVLRYLRLAAHRALGDPDGICEKEQMLAPTPDEMGLDEEDEDSEWDDEELDPAAYLGLFEWSAAPGKDRRDREGWQQSNPTLGHNPATHKGIRKALTEPEWLFRTEVLCQWPDGTMDGPFPPGSWVKGQNEPVEDADGRLWVAEQDKLVGDLWACIDLSHDREICHVTVCGQRADGRLQVEVVASRFGHDWVADYLQSEKFGGRIKAVTGQSRGAPVTGLMKTLREDPKFRIPVVEWSGGDLLDAHGLAFDLVRDEELRHNPQPALDVPAETAVKRELGGNGSWVIDRKGSPIDPAPLIAAIGAVWLMKRQPPPPAPPPPPPQAVAATDTTSDDADEGSYIGTDDLATIGF